MPDFANTKGRPPTQRRALARNDPPEGGIPNALCIPCVGRRGPSRGRCLIAPVSWRPSQNQGGRCGPSSVLMGGAPPPVRHRVCHIECSQRFRPQGRAGCAFRSGRRRRVFPAASQRSFAVGACVARLVPRRFAGESGKRRPGNPILPTDSPQPAESDGLNRAVGRPVPQKGAENPHCWDAFV